MTLKQRLQRAVEGKICFPSGRCRLGGEQALKILDRELKREIKEEHDHVEVHGLRQAVEILRTLKKVLEK